MKLRIVKRWYEKAAKFLFYIQQWEDDASFKADGDWVDRCGPYESHDDARRTVTEAILLNKHIDGSEIVVEEF